MTKPSQGSTAATSSRPASSEISKVSKAKLLTALQPPGSQRCKEAKADSRAVARQSAPVSPGRVHRKHQSSPPHRVDGLGPPSDPHTVEADSESLKVILHLLNAALSGHISLGWMRAPCWRAERAEELEQRRAGTSMPSVPRRQLRKVSKGQEPVPG